MKYSLIAVLISITLTYSATAQQKTVSNNTQVQPTDIYDNFKQNPSTGYGFLVLKSKRTGKVLFEDSIKNGQCTECYDRLTLRADSFYSKNEFSEASMLYYAAFKLNNDKGKVKHRFNAACSYIKLDNFDSAFEELNRIVFIAKFHNIYQFTSDKCLKPLHDDKRWQKLLDGVENNIQEAQKKLNSETIINQ